ncbi:MAG: peptidylprolyl isomerase [Candidatus Methanoplasma sp.]|nr:peptidylprolyl isomerase [Candidatus Methanoplasma sp.]
MADNDVKKIIRMDYKAYLADTDKLYDTTNEEVAKEANIYNEKFTYAPMAYIIGSGDLFPALDDALSSAEIGKEIEVLIPSEDAAGAKNPKLVEVFPVREFHRQEIAPYPGLQVTLGNRSGTVLSAGAGRVKVDFNNPLAGHDLIYKMTVTEVIEDQSEKAKAVVESAFGESEGFAFSFPDGRVTVTLPDLIKFNTEWPLAKFKVVQNLRSAFGVDTVEFIEVWTVPKKEKDPVE